MGTVAIVGIDHSGGEQLDEEEHGKLTHRGGCVEKHRLFKLDANDEVDDHCHARKEETAGHSFAVEHQEEGQIDERRTRLSLSILGMKEKGEEIRLSAYKGKKIVLYFYPKDSTSGCTAQACNLRDNYSELRKAGYEVIGVSVDNEKSHQKFIEKNNLPFTLIADTDKKLVEEFGVWGEKKLYGRAYMGTFRTTFLINEEGIVERIITPKEVKTKEHASQILNQ